MRRICMVGTFGFSEDLGALPDDVEIWIANEAHRRLGRRRPDRVFQMHPRDWREAERSYLSGGCLPLGVNANCFGRDQEHVEFLRGCGRPVYMQSPWEDIPTATRYPFEVVTTCVGVPLPPDGIKRLWATSSFGYMAALALTEHAHGETIAELFLSGIELPLGSWREQVWEWPNLAFYLGMAFGQGIAIRLAPAGSSLLSGPHYALGGAPQPGDADHWWMATPSAVIWDGTVRRLGSAREAVGGNGGG